MPLDDEARRRAAETKRRRTRKAIEEAVAAVANDHPAGMEGVTFAEVAKRAGLSEATVFRYFPNHYRLIESMADGVMELLRENPGSAMRVLVRPFADGDRIYMPVWLKVARLALEEGYVDREAFSTQLMSAIFDSPEEPS